AERAEAPPVARPAAPEPAVRVHGLNHYYGEGEARNQVLFGNSIDIPAGQLVVMTGPSGAGKTTLLTLIGALRSVHEGRIDVLGRDLSRLGGGELVEVRRDIGFIFQMHNLFDALSAYENVKMAAQLANGELGDVRQRCTGIMDSADRLVHMVDGRIMSDVVLHDALRICEFLRPINLFKALTPQQLSDVAEHVKKRRFAAGETVIREGEPGEEFFVISDGEVEVIRADHEVARLR